MNEYEPSWNNLQEGGEGKTCFYKKGKLAQRGTLLGSLYLLQGETVSPSANAAIAEDDTALWHCFPPKICAPYINLCDTIWLRIKFHAQITI